MAFDALSKENQFKAIDWLAERGVTRILTHGGFERFLWKYRHLVK
jgi:copper homeostasis protein